MPDLGSDQPVVVTAEEHVHPAIRKLARACIELARLVRRPARSSSDALTDGEQTHD